jgi:phosphatidate cytidylyltransferase
VLKRTISTIILWSLLLLCLRYFGADGAVWLITAMSVLTLYELYSMLGGMGIAPFKWLGLALGAAITMAPRYFEPSVSAAELLALGVIILSVRILGERKPENRVETLCWSLFGLVYVPFMLQFLVRIALIPETGLWLAFWLIAVTKLCDTGALLTGLVAGRHKMAPNISPKKTWEGLAGGVLTSVIAGAALAWGFRAFLPAYFTPLTGAVVALPVALLGAVSDLVESIIKRRADIKDTGNTIPGIGGVFDMSDSLILTAPVGWMVFHLLQTSGNLR